MQHKAKEYLKSYDQGHEITHLIECILHLYEMFCHYDSINLHQTCLFLSLVNMIIYNDSTNKIHRFANKLTSLFQFLHILVISYDRSPPINSCELVVLSYIQFTFSRQTR